MDKFSQIRGALREICKSGGDNFIFSAEVTSVSNQTCEVKVGEMTLSDVRLCSVVDNNDNNLLIEPKVPSQVLVMDMSKGEMRDLVVVKVSQTENIVINGGKLGGLIKIEELRKNLEKMTKRIDGIMDAIKNATPVAQDGGASLKATMVAGLNSLTDKEDFSGIEDKKVKH